MLSFPIGVIKVWAAKEGKSNDAGGRTQVCDSTMTLQLRRTFCTAHRQFESPLCVHFVFCESATSTSSGRRANAVSLHTHWRHAS